MALLVVFVMSAADRDRGKAAVATPVTAQAEGAIVREPSVEDSAVLAKVKGAGQTRVGVDGLRLPDGSMMPALNGVVAPPPLRWPVDRAWSPIRRRFVDRRGTEWYEHADGSFTTTLLVDRSDLGHQEAVTHVVHPVDPGQATIAEDVSPGPRPRR